MNRQGPTASQVFRNTYLAGNRRLFKSVVSQRQMEAALYGRSRSSLGVLRRGIRRLRPWFWPNLDDAMIWASASASTSYDPRFYLRDTPRPLLARLMKVVPHDSSVLDLGCNSGADLDVLRRSGFLNLWGVDAGEEALQLFEEHYPTTFATAAITHDLFQSYLLKRANKSFDAVHSNGATIELVHPSFPIVQEICRVANQWIFVAIEERGQAYPRYYLQQFEKSGFRLVYCERDAQLEHQSLLQFERFK